MPSAPDRSSPEDLARQRGRIATVLRRDGEGEGAPVPLSGPDLAEKLAQELRAQRKQATKRKKREPASPERVFLGRLVTRLFLLFSLYLAGLFFVTVFIVRDAGQVTLASQGIFRAIYYPVMYRYLPGPVLDAWYMGAVRLCLASPDCRVDEHGLYVTLKGDEDSRRIELP
ncbi:MAG: hypothetical protein WD673_05960 [Alphaproteobacteria bacterium]